MRLWEMGGVLFSNFYFHSHSENKGKNKRKVPLESLGELAYLLSVLSVGMKDLSANNLFQCSLFSIHHQYTEAFGGRIPNDKYCTFIKRLREDIYYTEKMQKALCLIHILVGVLVSMDMLCKTSQCHANMILNE